MVPSELRLLACDDDHDAGAGGRTFCFLVCHGKNKTALAPPFAYATGARNAVVEIATPPLAMRSKAAEVRKAFVVLLSHIHAIDPLRTNPLIWRRRLQGTVPLRDRSLCCTAPITSV